MRLMMMLGVALLVLTACGEPAYVNDAGHGEDAEHSAVADDHAAEEGEHAEDADHDAAEAEEGDHAEDEEHDAAESEEGEAAAAMGEGETATDAETTEDEAAADTEEESADEDAAMTEEETEPAESEDTEGDDTAAVADAGDPVAGEELFNMMYTEVGFACVTCHNVDSEERLIGPGLLNISITGADRVEGLSATEYIYQSITMPNAYVVEEYPENLMPQTYTELFTEEQIQDIVAYVLTMNG